MADIEKLSLNLATFEAALDLHGAVDLAARNGVRHVAPVWRHVEREGAREIHRILRSGGVEATSLATTSGFVAEDGSARRRLLDEQRRAIEAAATIGAPCLAVQSGGLWPGFKDLAGAQHMVEDGMMAVLDEALGAGVVLALEPAHPMRADQSVVTTVAQALDICDGLATTGAGVALDLYNSWWDPALPAQIERAGRRIVLCQLADWLTPTKSLDDDRGLMGDGVIELPFWCRLLRQHGYDRPFEIEIVSRFWCSREPRAFLHAIIERFDSAC